MNNSSNVKNKVIVGLSLVLGVSAIGAISAFSIGKSRPKCEDTIIEAMQINKEKRVEPNNDGGVFILMQESTAGLYSFVTFVGPRTAENLYTHLTSRGLAAVKTEQSGQCLGENGFVYSIVKGRYYVPQQ